MKLNPEATPGNFSSLPGTADYMPPEAQVECGPSLDVFSFGHLSLFTIIQSPLYPLLPSTYCNDANVTCARSEVKRREQYLHNAEQCLGRKQLVILLIKQCLHNKPPQRPPTADLITKLQDILSMLLILGSFSSSLPLSTPLSFHSFPHMNTATNFAFIQSTREGVQVPCLFLQVAMCRPLKTFVVEVNVLSITSLPPLSMK